MQWLEQKTAPDLFEMSYYDTVEAGAVLTIVRVEKAKEKNLWRLSKIDIERVEKILELAKKKERGEWDENQGELLCNRTLLFGGGGGDVCVALDD